MRLYYLFVFILILFGSCSKKQNLTPDNNSPIDSLENIEYQIDSAKILSGNERVKILWWGEMNTEVKKVVIYWNDNMDSLVFSSINEISQGDSSEIIIKNLPEDSYVFQIYYQDKTKSRYKLFELAGRTYGSVYESKLKNVAVSAIMESQAKTLIQWDYNTDPFLGAEVRFKKKNNKEITKITEYEKGPTVLNNYKYGTYIFYRTLYKPEINSIDTFYTKWDSLKLGKKMKINIKEVIDQSSDCSCGRAANLIDGDKDTYWQPLQDDRNDKKISFTIDLGSTHSFNKVKQYWKVGSEYITQYKIKYSKDKNIWETAYESTSGLSKNGSNKFPMINARYVKIIYNLNSTNMIRLAEIEVWKDL